MVAICHERNQNGIFFHEFADSFVDMHEMIEETRRGKVQASPPVKQYDNKRRARPWRHAGRVLPAPGRMEL
jgi:hypothetical protein